MAGVCVLAMRVETGQTSRFTTRLLANRHTAVICDNRCSSVKRSCLEGTSCELCACSL